MKESNKLPLIYVIGMPIVFLVAFVLNTKYIQIGNAYLYISVFLYPLTYLISGLITKKTSYKDGLLIMAVSLVTVALASVVRWSMLDILEPWSMIYAFLSFLICQLIFIYGYDFLIKTKKDTYGFVFILLVLIGAIDNAFFGIIVEGQWVSISILIRLIYVVVLPVVLARNSKSAK